MGGAGVSQAHGTPVVQIQGTREPQTGFDSPDLASRCCSHQPPAVTLGIRPALMGLPLLDSGDRGRHSKRVGLFLGLASMPVLCTR